MGLFLIAKRKIGMSIPPLSTEKISIITALSPHLLVYFIRRVAKKRIFVINLAPLLNI